jgi:predicted phage tail protein
VNFTQAFIVTAQATYSDTTEQPLREIRLSGELGKRFGRIHRLAVDTPAEAIRALCVIVSGFRDFLLNSEQNGIRYRLIAGKQEITPVNLDADIHMRRGISASFRLVPVMRGSKSPWASILVGAVLIAATGGFGAPLAAGIFATGGAMAGASAFIGQLGISLMLGGVVGLLASDPPNSDLSLADDKASYIFNGPVNTTQQGECVPVAYGEIICGSAVISSGYRVGDIV